MTVTIDTFGANFIHYLGNVVTVLNDVVRAKKLCKGKVKKWEGSKLVKHVHLERSPAIAFVEDGGATAPSRKQGYQEASAYRKFCTGTVGITDGQLNNATKTTHAAISVVESELRGMMTGIKNFYNYFWTRDGTGVVTLLGATASGTTLTVDDARLLWDGGDFSILDAATPTTVHTTFRVKSTARSYDNTLKSATVTPTATVAAAGQDPDDYIVWGTGDWRSYGRAINGLDSLIDDSSTTFQGIDTSVWTRYTSPVIDAGSGTVEVTPDQIRRMLAMLDQEGGKVAQDTFILGNVWEMVRFDEMFESAVRITPDSKVMGQATPSFQSSLGKVTLVTDKDAPYGKLFFVCPSEITFAVQKELHWRPLTNGGSGILARQEGNLRYTATAMEQSELFIEARNKCGKIKDLGETVATAF